MELVSVRSGAVHLPGGPRIHGAETGDAHGEPVLFLHGWPDSWFSFSRVMSLLPGSIRAIAIDQRGYGESEHPESGYAIPDMALDAVSVLDALGTERATIVGHSYGTFVARQMAIASPQRVSKLLLIATGFMPSTNAVMRDLLSALRELPDPIPVEFAREFQSSTAYRPLPPEFFERIIVETLKLPPRLWRLLIERLLEYDAATGLGSIAVPTLLLWGDHDALFSRAEQERIVAAVPGARLKVYVETGHCPNWEIPEQVASDIADFVAR
jgi:pimeloyl-ACP methyl ester carboxylesterase